MIEIGNNPVLWFILSVVVIGGMCGLVHFVVKKKEKRERLKYMLRHTTVKTIPASYSAPNIHCYQPTDKLDTLNPPKED